MKKETKNNSTSISEELLQRKPVEHTPFEAVKFENEPWFLGLGSYRLPITGETYEELVNNLEAEKWNIIPLIVSITLEILKSQNNGN